MAQSNSQNQIGRISAEGQASLVAYLRVILDIHNKQSDFRDKLEIIDVAYARYKAIEEENPGTGQDTPAGQQACGINADDITVPVVVSHVDSFVSYLNDIYLSGYPIFPVVPTPNSILEANQLQSIMDDHANRGRYQRHLALSFKDAIKYNLSAVEVDWAALDLFNISSNYTEPTKQKIEASPLYINRLKRLDMYNTILDWRVNPVDIPMYGEYAGYIDIEPRVQIKRLLAYYESTGYGYHTAQAMSTKLGTPSATSPHLGYYTEKPQISELINSRNIRNGQLNDWIAYLKNEKQSTTAAQLSQMSDVYEHITLYARIIPAEHGIHNVPKKNTPQVWKLCFINHEKLVYAKRIFTIYDTLPIYISQPLEDGFSFQTKSTAENSIPFQTAMSKLFSIRLNAARRAVVDRAIYDQTAFNPNDINSPYPAAKIPFKANAMLTSGKTIDSIYKSIPFDSRGTETVVQDMRAMSEMSDDMNGINKPQRGVFQKGNKSRKEWEDTMAGSYGRMRNVALMLEFQQIAPIKEELKLNIFQYGVKGTYQNMVSGDTYELTAESIEKIRKNVNNFKLADGLLPADKIASTDVIAQGMQMLSASQPLQLAFGAMLPKLFLHFLAIGGVQNLDQYMPTQAQAPAQGTASNTGTV